jgi:hypothetical protein
MKYKIIFLSLLCSSCSFHNNKDKKFSNKDIININVALDNKENKASAIQNSSKEALSIAADIFSVQGADIKKFITSFKAKEKKNGKERRLDIKYYFNTESFVDNFKPTPKSQIYYFLKFYSPYEKLYESFTRDIKTDCDNSYCVKISSSISDIGSDNDYKVYVEVYSYLIDNPINNNQNIAISSASAKIYIGKNFIDQLMAEEKFMGGDKNDVIRESLSKCGDSIYKKSIETIEKYKLNQKRINLVFLNVNDLNTVKKIKDTLKIGGFDGLKIESYYENKAVFSIFKKDYEEYELSSRIMRLKELPINIDSIDKGEITFVIGTNFIENE